MSTTTPAKTRNRWRHLTEDQMDEALAKEFGHATYKVLFGPRFYYVFGYIHYGTMMRNYSTEYLALVDATKTEAEKIKAAKDVLANASDHFRHAEGNKAVHLAKVYLEAFLTGRH